MDRHGRAGYRRNRRHGRGGASHHLESAWDEAQPSLRPVNTVAAWGNLDVAIDDALSALRDGPPDLATVARTLADLQSALADPMRCQDTTMARKPLTVSGIIISDANGQPLPCEVMLDTFRTMLADATLSDAARSAVGALQARGTERCNADDPRPLDPDCTCPACSRYSRAYLQHVFKAGEIIASMLLTGHNLHSYQDLIAGLREAIAGGGRLEAFSETFAARHEAGDGPRCDCPS